jgi:CheY-like chemotaxis protein
MGELKSNFYPELQDKVVLSVDDNDMNHLVITKLLEKAGIKTIIAKNGAAAVSKLMEGLKPDAILMDLQMPVMNGLEASSIIKEKIGSHIPIIINSGNVDALERWKLKRMGINDFLEKPYSIDDIFNKLMKNMSVAAG